MNKIPFKELDSVEMIIIRNVDVERYNSKIFLSSLIYIWEPVIDEYFEWEKERRWPYQPITSIFWFYPPTNVTSIGNIKQLQVVFSQRLFVK